MTRRALLRGSAAAALAGTPLLLSACKGMQSMSAPPPPARDVTVLRKAISAEQAMISRYDSASAQLHATAPAAVLTAMATVRSQHAAHLAQLRSRLHDPNAASASPSPGSPAASPAATPAAGDLATVVSGLTGAEQGASDHLLTLLPGLPPSLAELLASVAASEATHVPLLRTAAGS